MWVPEQMTESQKKVKMFIIKNNAQVEITTFTTNQSNMIKILQK